MANRIEELNYVPEMPRKGKEYRDCRGRRNCIRFTSPLLIRWPGIQ